MDSTFLTILHLLCARKDNKMPYVSLFYCMVRSVQFKNCCPLLLYFPLLLYLSHFTYKCHKSYFSKYAVHSRLWIEYFLKKAYFSYFLSLTNSMPVAIITRYQVA